MKVDLKSGQTISAIRWGAAPIEVIYLHGGGQNAHTWDLVAAIVDAPALAIDLPGHGHSSWRFDRDYRPHTNAQAIAEVLKSTGIQPKLLVGMSQGGLTAISLASGEPDLVPDLILVDILPQLSVQQIPYDRSKLGSVGLLDGPREFASLEDMEEATNRATGGTRSTKSLKRGVWHNSIQLPNGRWRWRYDDLSGSVTLDHSGLWDALAQMGAPLTLVKGGMSPLLSTELLAHLQKVRPDAQLVTAPEAGHAVQSESPQLLASAIRERVYPSIAPRQKTV